MKTVAHGVCLLVLLLLVGCGEVSAPEGGEFEPTREGVLTVATDRLPQPGFWEGLPEPEGGFEWDLARRLSERFGLDRVEVVERPFDRLVAGELDGADIAMAQITPTFEREEVLDFSDPYLSANPAVVVAGDREVKDVMEARDLSWAVQTGTTLETALERLIVPHGEVLHLAEQTEVVEAVLGGEAEAALLDLPVALAYASEHPALRVASQISTDEALAVALPEGSANREAVDTAIRAMINDGTLSKMAKTWLGADLRDGAFTVEEVPLMRTK